jgi:prepilin-type processing-associated H-X9-DG protein/prepilin-type N-terminal cleavage/methylation domain-containing protein
MFDYRTRSSSLGFVEARVRVKCLAGKSVCRLGFTLTELLVVIAMISILATLLSTAFNNTKARSQKVTCLSNVRQLQVAWSLYLGDNEDLLPLNRTVDNPLPEQYFGRLLSSNSWAVGSPKQDTTPANLIRGSLFAYTGKSVAIYHCPADHSTVAGREDVLRNRSYSMDAYLGGDDAEFDPQVKSKDSELITPSPEKVFVFIEEHQESPWLGAFWVMPREKLLLSSSVNWTSMPSDRHNQGCNISFADGHVEYWKWYWPKRAGLETKLTANGHELRDLKRLQEAVPKP